jgi:glucokinase
MIRRFIEQSYSGSKTCRCFFTKMPDPKPRRDDASRRIGGSLTAKKITVADIGGTHARFGFATLESGRVSGLSRPVTLITTDHASFETAWEEFGRRSGSDITGEIAISFAGPVDGDFLKLTNSPWVIRPSLLKQKLGVTRLTIINDFGAVAYAVSELGDDHFLHLFGSQRALPREGVTSVIGPGTGLGVAQLLIAGESTHVIETEGGHIDFAPLDALEDKILADLRGKFRRVSVERLVSGSGLRNIYNSLAAIEGRPATQREDSALWSSALQATDTLAAAALDRFCLVLGAVAGDLALAQGADAVVVAGGLGWRLRDHLPGSGFEQRFIAKGRFERRMQNIPVKLIAHPEPGLLGAAVAFAREHESHRSAGD